MEMNFKDDLNLFQKEPLLRILRRSRHISDVTLYLIVLAITFVIPLIVALLTKRAFTSDVTGQGFLSDPGGISQAVLGGPLFIVFLRRILTNLSITLHELYLEERIKLFGGRLNEIIDTFNKHGNSPVVYAVCFLLLIPTNLLWVAPILKAKAPIFLITVIGTGSESVANISLIGWTTILLNVSLSLYAMYLVCYKLIVIVILFFSINNVNKNENKLPIIFEPIHPDGAGGLGGIGKICLLISIPFFATGISIAAVMFNEVFITKNPNYPLYFVQIGSYLIGAFIVFMLPLYPFHSKMKARKEEALALLGKRFHELYQIYQQILRGEKRKFEDSTLNKLDKTINLYNLAEQMPVWPFDAATLRRFFVVILSPITLVLPEIISFLSGILFKT